MNIYDILILAAVAVCFCLAVRRIVRQKGGCGCSGGSGCTSCSGGSGCTSCSGASGGLACSRTSGCTSCSVGSGCSDCSGTSGCTSCSGGSGCTSCSGASAGSACSKKSMCSECSERSGRLFQLKAGADTDKLSENDLTEIDLKSDCYPVELSLLSENQQIGAIIVSNTPYCKKLRESGDKFISALDDMSQIVGGEVKTAEYETDSVAEALQSASCCFVKNRYTLATGRNLHEAIVALKVLEKSAEVNDKARLIGGPCHIEKETSDFMRDKYLNSYSKNEIVTEKRIDVTDNEELQLRKALVEYGLKLTEANLVQGTWGNLSVRLDDKYMLVTPSGIDYYRLTAEDMVKVNYHTMEWEGEQKPTSEKGLHASIYLKRKDVGAVIHTHSKYCCIFAAAGKPVPAGLVGSAGSAGPIGSAGSAGSAGSDGIEKSLLDELQWNIAKYGLAGSRQLTDNVTEALGSSTGCVMSNHGMVCTGKSLKDAMKNCRILEDCAMEYIEKCNKA